MKINSLIAGTVLLVLIVVAMEWRQTALENELHGLRVKAEAHRAHAPGPRVGNGAMAGSAVADAEEQGRGAPAASDPAERLAHLEELLQKQADRMEEVLARLAQSEERASRRAAERERQLGRGRYRLNEWSDTTQLDGGRNLTAFVSAKITDSSERLQSLAEAEDEVVDTLPLPKVNLKSWLVASDSRSDDPYAGPSISAYVTVPPKRLGEAPTLRRVMPIFYKKSVTRPLPRELRR